MTGTAVWESVTLAGRDAPEMLALVERLGWTSLNRGPLAMGLISDKYATDTLLPDNDVRGKPAPDWMRYFENGRPSPRWLARRDAIRDILAGDGRTPVQGALAWIWARSPATVPRCRASAPWTMCGRTSARSAAVR